MTSFVDLLVPELLQTLSDPVDSVVNLDVQVIAEVCHPKHDGVESKALFRGFIKTLLGFFRVQEKLRIQRGSFVIR